MSARVDHREQFVKGILKMMHITRKLWKKVFKIVSKSFENNIKKWKISPKCPQNSLKIILKFFKKFQNIPKMLSI